MKKYPLISLLLSFVLLLSLSVRVSAYSEYGVIYDETEDFYSADLQELGEQTLPDITRECGFDIRVDIYTSLGNAESLEAAAEYMYEAYDYGCGDDKLGVSLTILLQEEGNGWTLDGEDHYLCFGGNEEVRTAAAPVIMESIAKYLTPQAWQGDLTRDRETICLLVESLAKGVQNYAGGESTAVKSGYITDEVGLLSAQQLQQLDALAADLSKQYGIGLYALIVDDHTDYGDPDIFTNLYTLYHDRALGEGAQRDGVILMLSMSDREYATFVYGPNAEYAVDAYGITVLEDAFLAEFGADRYAEGMQDYLSAGGKAFALAQAGEPIRKSLTLEYGLAYIIAIVIALVVTLIQRGKMKTVRTGAQAQDYISAGGMEVSQRSDVFLYQNVQTQQKEERSKSRSGGGGHGTSGSF